MGDVQGRGGIEKEEESMESRSEREDGHRGWTDRKRPEHTVYIL